MSTIVDIWIQFGDLRFVRACAGDPAGRIPAAGEIARQLDVPQNTMSAHLGILARAGVVRSERRSRSIVYRADLDGPRLPTLFLIRDCCADSPELCAPLIADLTPCC